MKALIPFLSVLGALTPGAAGPGPSFVFVARISLALWRRDGTAAAPGVSALGLRLMIETARPG